MRHISTGITRGLRQLSPVHGTSADPVLAEHLNRLQLQGVAGSRCFFCAVSFLEPDVSEVVHLHDEHEHGSDNLQLGCPVCHSVQHLDLVLKKFGSDPGRMIYLPELTQGELNALYWSIINAKGANELPNLTPEQMQSIEFKWSGVGIYMKLARRASLVPEQLREVGKFVNFLKKLTDDQYVNRDVFLKNMRWLPPLEGFDKLSGKLSFGRLPLDTWSTIVGDL